MRSVWKHELIFSSRSESLSKEIALLQGQLKDYNLLIERQSTATSPSDAFDVEHLKEEANALKSKNLIQMQKVDQVFTERNGYLIS